MSSNPCYPEWNAYPCEVGDWIAVVDGPWEGMDYGQVVAVDTSPEALARVGGADQRAAVTIRWMVGNCTNAHGLASLDDVEPFGSQYAEDDARAAYLRATQEATPA